MRAFKRILFFTIPLLLVGFFVSILYKWNYIQHEQHIPDEFNIPYLTAGVDHNKNRIDDGKDILEGAKQYIEKNPTYEPLREYPDGWPVGNKGQAGDVIAQAFKYAGYDLKTLINQDIKKNPEVYEDKAPTGENVAFRSVEAQSIFFSRYMSQYSTDYYNKNEWQPGDVVVFEKKHIAIVADKVNENGVRFIIHHFWDHQAGYFQDVLETDAWGKIVGHYRISEQILAPKTDSPNSKQSTKTQVTN